MPRDLYKGLFRLNLANAYVWVGDSERALPYSREALAIFRRIQRGTWEANALMTMGNAYLRQQRFADAWETLNLTLEVARQSGEHRVYGRALLNLGMAGLQLKKPEARALVEEALPSTRRTQKFILPSSVRSSCRKGCAFSARSPANPATRPLPRSA